MEIPLSQVLAAMEHIGVAADGPGIAAFGETLQARIDDIQRQIYDAVGYTFNLNSPKQLAKALFEDLGLPAKKRPSPAIPPTPMCWKACGTPIPPSPCCWNTGCWPS